MHASAYCNELETRSFTLFHSGKKGFYQDAENTPDWFPHDIAFRAPTHKHGYDCCNVME